MAYTFNPFTGNLDYYQRDTTTTDRLTSTGSTLVLTDGHITRTGTNYNTYSNISFSGVSTSNTNSYVLYYNCTKSGLTITFSVYKNAAKTQLVAQGSRSGNGTITLTAQNGSGLTGTIDVIHTQDDTYAGNLFSFKNKLASDYGALELYAPGHGDGYSTNGLILNVGQTYAAGNNPARYLEVRSNGNTGMALVPYNDYGGEFATPMTMCVRGINFRSTASNVGSFVNASDVLATGRTTGFTAISGLFNPSANHSNNVAFTGLDFGLLAGGVASGKLGGFTGARAFIYSPASDCNSTIRALDCYVGSPNSAYTYTCDTVVADFHWQAMAAYGPTFANIKGINVELDLSSDYGTSTTLIGSHIHNLIGLGAYPGYGTGSSYVYGLLIESISNGQTGTWGLLCDEDAQIDDGCKLYLGGTTTTYGVDYFLKNASGTLDLVTTTSSGARIATGATQKLGFFGATPVVQPATGGATATFTANAGTAVNDASTFDGYTLKEIVKALRNLGILA